MLFEPLFVGHSPLKPIVDHDSSTALTEPEELWAFIASALPRFDTGNLVVAFTSAAKVDEGEP